jgi:excisionase family DNA binding protein
VVAAPTEKKGRGIELLGAEEVAGLLGIKESTVWRWCREGTLPCLKVGKHWRVRREALEDFLSEKERSTTLVGQLGSFLRVPDNVLVIAQNLDLLHRMDAAFFRVGEAHDGLLVKFYSGENSPPDELIAQLEENGLAARSLQREGRFFMRPEEDPLDERTSSAGSSSRRPTRDAPCGPLSTGSDRSIWRRPSSSNRGSPVSSTPDNSSSRRPRSKG